MSAALRLAVGIVLALTLLPWSASVLAEAWLRTRGHAADPLAVGGGLAAALALVWWRRPNWLVHTTIHELAHVAASLALLVRIRAFQTTDGAGGAVLHDRVDPLRTTMIALAPYTLPLLLAPALAARWVVDEPGWPRTALSAACGFLLVHHLHGLWHNVRLNIRGRQGDLARAGRVLSLVAIASVLLLVLAWWLVTVGRG